MTERINQSIKKVLRIAKKEKLGAIEKKDHNRTKLKY